MATVQDEHMKVGDWSVELDWSPAFLSEVVDDNRRPRKIHALFYDPDDVLIACGVLLRVAGDETGLTIGGRNTLWYLGSDDLGRIIADQEFVAGTNKLSNPHFTLLDLYWETGENTAWSFVTGGALTLVAPGADEEGEIHDDVMTSSESWPVRAGQEYRHTLTAQRNFGGELIGRIRLRRTYTAKSGTSFQHPQLGTGYEAWTASQHGDITISTDPLKTFEGQSHVARVVTNHRQLISAPSFGPTLAGWTQGDGTWTAAVGPDGWVARTAPIATPNPKWMTADPGAYPTDWFVVAEGEEFFFDGWIGQEAGVTGVAIIKCLVSCFPADATKPDFWVEAGFNGLDVNRGWYYHNVTFSIPEGYNLISPQLHTEGHTSGGAWLFDNVHMWRTRGNTDYIKAPGIPVIPERSYTAKVKFRSEGDVTGIVQLRASAVSINRKGKILHGPTLSVSTGDEDTELADGIDEVTFDMVAPSGYDMIIPWLFAEDVYGGAFEVGEWDIKETDTSTRVVDIYTPATYGDHTVTVDHTVPEGAESVSVSLVAEESAAGWGVTNVALKRIGVTPATGNAIVSSLLANMPLTAGAVNCPETIPYDWHVLNLTPRQALDHYCTVVSDPPREYRVNPDRSLDVGTAADVFTDHGAANALLSTDIDVEALPTIESDVEGRVTHITVVGAERTRRDGTTYTVTASAQVPGDPEYDWNGQVIHRSRIVSDGTVDHLGYAQALADDLAAKEADPAISITANLTGAETRPGLREGDWIYYEPDTYNDDDTLIMVEGRPVHVRRTRILGRTRQLGPGYRLVLRRTDGTTFEPTGVRWSEADAMSLTIGDRRPEWQADPQGHAAGVQYLRDRISAPR